MFTWNSLQTVLPLVLGGGGLVAWLIYEYYVPSMPMLPVAILHDRTAIVSFLGTLLVGTVQFGLLYYLPLYFQVSIRSTMVLHVQILTLIQVSKSYSPLISGVALLPTCVSSGFASSFCGSYISKTGRYRSVTWAGWALLVLGCGLLQLFTPRTSVAAWVFINMVYGAGIGTLISSLAVASQAPQKSEHMALATGLTPFFRAVGQAIGIVIGSAVSQNVLTTTLESAHSAALRKQATSLGKSIANMAVILHAMPEDTARDELLKDFNNSLRAVWWVLTGVSVLGGLLSLAMREISLGPSKKGPANMSQENSSDETIVAEVNIYEDTKTDKEQKRADEPGAGPTEV
jgi:hypothetical protein